MKLPFNMTRLYLLLVVIRFISCWSSGYVHPDEFFQSYEVSARDVFGVRARIPWEFDPARPARTSVVPSVIYFVRRDILCPRATACS